MVTIPINVQTISQPGAMLIPVSFSIRDRTFGISEIVDSWHGLDHAYYKVFADDGNMYVIRHDLEDYTWELVQMEVLRKR